MDNSEIYWVFELAIKPGRFEDLKTLIADMVEATRRNEVGALNYEWAISDDQQCATSMNATRTPPPP